MNIQFQTYYHKEYLSGQIISNSRFSFNKIFSDLKRVQKDQFDEANFNEDLAYFSPFSSNYTIKKF